jgi:plastocyanin
MRVSSTSCGFLVCAVIALGLLVNSMAPRAAAPPTHTVTIDAMRFQPENLTVKPGDSVVWVNRDPFPHTVTATAGTFDSKEIAAGESWTLTSAREGDFAYTCILHPTMKGAVRVK